MNLVERAKNILISPAKEWEVIKEEEISVSDMFTKYAMLLAAIPAVSGLIGQTLFGYFGSFGGRITWAVLTYILSLAGVYIIAFIIDMLAPSFGSTKNLNASLKVVIFSYTASWVGGIFSLIPALSFIAFLAFIYSAVLMYMGLSKVKDVPKDKMVGYFIVLIIVAIVVYVIIGAIIGAATFGGMAVSSAM